MDFDGVEVLIRWMYKTIVGLLQQQILSDLWWTENGIIFASFEQMKLVFPKVLKLNAINSVSLSYV